MRPKVRRILFAARAIQTGVGRILKILLAVFSAPTVCPDARTIPGTYPADPMPRPFTRAPRSRRRLPTCASLGALLGLGLATPGALSAADSANRAFNVPAGDAIVALKQFSAQSGEQLLYSFDDIHGVQTHAVSGEFTAIAALNQMLERTSLRARQDETTKAISIIAVTKSRAPAPPAQRPPADSNDSPAKPNTTPMKTPSILAVAATWLLAGAVAPAQTAPTPTKEDAVQLSAFTVNTEKDHGYLAGESLLGGRMATDLSKSPADTTVLTKEFLDDIGALNYIDAGAFLTNAVVANPQDADYGNNISFRGIAGGFPARNYFRNLNNVDFFVVERLESARGPNAILFGDGVVGGVINTSTKQAKIGRDRSAFTVRTDSEGSLRSTVDLNRSLGKNAAVRVNLLAANDRNWVSTYLNNRRSAQIAGTYRPWQQGEFRLEAETGRIKTNYTQGSFSDATSLWGGVGYNALATPTVIPAGAFRFSTTNDRITWSGGKVENFRGYVGTNGSGLAIEPTKAAFVPNFPSIARNFSIQPTDLTTTDIDYGLVAGFYQHQWTSRLVTEVAYQYAAQLRYQNTVKFNSLQTDANQFLADGSLNPRFGERYMETNSGSGTESHNNNIHYDGRVITAYELPVTRWRQKINFFASRRIEIFDSKGNRVGRNNGPVADLTNATNLLYYHAYLKDGPKSWTIAPADDANYTWEKYRRDQSRQAQKVNSFQLSTVATFWKGRINYLGGVRRDFYKVESEAYTAAALPNSGRDAKGRVVGTALLTTPIDVAVTTRSSGVTVFLIPQIGVSVNYSETFNPVGVGAPGIYSDVFGPTQGSGKSAGLRFILSDKVEVKFGYYDSAETGRVSNGTNTEINRLWTNLNKAERALPAFRDTNDQNAKGYELDGVLNLSRDFRFRGNLAFPKASQSNTLPGLRRYFAENIAEWDAAAANPDTTALAQVVADIAALRLRLDNAAEGRQLNGRADYTASLFGNYTVPTGLFKKVSIGAGATFVGKAIIGNQPNRPFDYFKASARYVALGSLGYRFRLWNHNFNAQVNVSNLFDHDDPVFTGTATRAATATSASQVLRSGFYYVEPRKYALTLSVDL